MSCIMSFYLYDNFKTKTSFLKDSPPHPRGDGLHRLPLRPRHQHRHRDRPLPPGQHLRQPAEVAEVALGGQGHGAGGGGEGGPDDRARVGAEPPAEVGEAQGGFKVEKMLSLLLLLRLLMMTLELGKMRARMAMGAIKLRF